jgi:hypothetical protein
MNTFDIPDWASDDKATLGEGCVSWCTAHLYYVPAAVEGRWTTSRGTLTLRQAFQVVAGTLTTPNGDVAVSGRLRGAELTLEVEGTPLRATVRGDRLDGALAGSRLPR